VVDAKPNVGYIAQKEAVHVIVRGLKDQKFAAKLQIISVQYHPLEDPKNANISDEWKSISSKNTNSTMISVKKSDLGDSS
jgi:hypothetical protein